MHDLVKDISSLTLIKESILKSISNIIEDSICHYILEAISLDEDVIIIDFGFGLLNINISSDELEYKFIPSKKLEKKILKSINTNNSPLVSSIEKKLNKRIINTYKELL